MSGRRETTASIIKLPYFLQCVKLQSLHGYSNYELNTYMYMCILLASDLTIVQGVGEDRRVHAAYAQIPITDVGEDSASGGALLCITNLPTCCATQRQGEWFYPNGTKVGIPANGDDFYRNRGTSAVRLHRRNNAMQPTGRYCCEVATTCV
jgi:hypothetical protein